MRTLVLLSAHNGARFLRVQLDSLLAQGLPGVEILVRDDGSTDETPAILEEYRMAGKLRWTAGENLGPARSFWTLLRDCGEAEYYAFCDQDDSWDADKLETAVAALSRIPAVVPALYCGEVRITDAALRPIPGHVLRRMPADYPHALLKNIAPGCTFVFNRAARGLFASYDAERLGIDLHDWTAFQIAACFGQVLVDPVPHMGYRQHGGNAIGVPRPALRTLVGKVRSFWGGPMKNSRQRQAQRLVAAFGEAMAPENRALTVQLARYPEDRQLKRALLRRLWRDTKTADGRLAFLLAAADRL